jgi:hypothetical protein
MDFLLQFSLSRRQTEENTRSGTSIPTRRGGDGGAEPPPFGARRHTSAGIRFSARL